MWSPLIHSYHPLRPDVLGRAARNLPASLHRHLIPHLQPERLGGRAIAYRNFQKPAAADQGEGLAGRDVTVGFLERADLATFDANVPGLFSLDYLITNVRRGVAVVVEVDDCAGLLVLGDRGYLEEDGIGDGLGKRSDLGAGRQHPSNGGEDVAAVECAAWRPLRTPSDFVRAATWMQPPRPGDQAIVRADDDLLIQLADEHAAVGAHARVDDGKVECAGGEAVDGALKRDRAAEDVLGRNLVGDVDQEGVIAMAEDGGFHNSGVRVGEAEVGSEGDDLAAAGFVGGWSHTLGEDRLTRQVPPPDYR